MRRLLITLALFAFLLPVNAQDEITFRTGESVKVKVLEVGMSEVSYKKADNLNGPSYSVSKDKLFMIKYENGTKDVFGTGDQNNATTANVAVQPVTGSATIYFFRPGKFVGSSPKIIVGTPDPDEVVVEVHNGRWYKCIYEHPGHRDFVTGIYSMSSSKLPLDVEPGKTYYIRCSIMKGLGLQSQIEIVDEQTAKKEMAGLKEQEKAK